MSLLMPDLLIVLICPDHHQPPRPRIGDAERAQRNERQRLHHGALAARGVRRQRSDQSFDEKPDQRRRAQRRVLLRQMRGRLPR